jgi:hypothetical protein
LLLDGIITACNSFYGDDLWRLAFNLGGDCFICHNSATLFAIFLGESRDVHRADSVDKIKDGNYAIVFKFGDLKNEPKIKQSSKVASFRPNRKDATFELCSICGSFFKSPNLKTMA